MATALGNNAMATATTTTTSAPAAPSAVTATIAAPNETNFGVELFNLITAHHNSNDQNNTTPAMNVIISPLLLESTLALLYLGSAGVTAEQLKSILRVQRFNGNNAKMANYYASHLTIARAQQQATKILLAHNILLLQQQNAQQRVADEFQKVAHKYFHATTKQITLDENVEKLRTQINGALESVAMQPLKQIAINANTIADNGSMAAGTAFVLTAANLESKWFLPFSAYRSGYYDFHLNAAQQKSVAMLFDDDMFVKFGEFHELDAKAIELPYECDCVGDDPADYIEDLAMLVILPNQRDGLAKLKEQLESVNLRALTERMQMESVQVVLPKFSIEYECSLRQHFEQLGLSSLQAEAPNFSNLVAEPNKSNASVKIADILHKVRIDVNESGSEVSKIKVEKPIVLSNSFGPKKKFFRADHPFYFAVRNNEVTYFLGCVQHF